MEVRASYVLVGLFVVALMAGLLGFVVWTARSVGTRAVTFYDILFTGSVTGLSEGSQVRYRGVPIGRVSGIRLGPDNLERIRVTIEIADEVPIKTDTMARLEASGLTGVAFVQLYGGTQTAPALASRDGERYPVITSQSSAIEAVMEGAPLLLRRAGEILSPANQQRFNATLDSVATVAAALAARADDGAQIVTNLRRITDELAPMTGELRRSLDALAQDMQVTLATMRGLAGAADDQVGRIGGDLRRATTNITQLSQQLNRMVEENRGPLRDFSATGLYQFTQFVAEARALVSSLSRLSTEFERDPARFLFGDQQKGYETK